MRKMSMKSSKVLKCISIQCAKMRIRNAMTKIHTSTRHLRKPGFILSCALLLIGTTNAVAQTASPLNGPTPVQANTVPIVTSTLPLGAQSPGKVFSFIDGAINLKPGSSDGNGILTIHLTVFVSGKTPKFVEYGPGPAVVRAGAARAIGDPASGDWQIPIVVTGLQKDKPLTRHLQVTFNNASETGSYTISNAYPDTFSWNVISLGGTSSWSEDQPLIATVIVGPVPVTDLLANAVLTDDTTGRQFASGDLQVCFNRTAACEVADGLQANHTYRLFLRPPTKSRPFPGKYTGSIELIGSGNRSSAANVTIYVTDLRHQAEGVGMLLIGILISFAITVGIRNGLARTQLLAPAVELHDAFARLDDRVTKLECASLVATTTIARLRDWERRLTKEELQKASLVPSWWSIAAPPPPNPQPYQQLLDEAGLWVAALTTIVETGLAPLAALKTDKIADPATRQTVEQKIGSAWHAIDILAVPPNGTLSPAPSSDALATTISAQVSSAQSAVNTALAAIGGAASAGGNSRSMESQHLRFQIAALSLASWTVAGLLTAAVGSYVLVFSHLDFGRPSDLWLCLLWGMGLPAVGGQLTLAAPSSLAGSLGVNLIKLGQ